MAFNALTALLSWTFIPGFLAGVLLRALYKYNLLARPPPGPQGVALSAAHRKWAMAAVVGAYLAFTLVRTDWELPMNYYAVLGVGHDAEDEELRRSFKKLARIHHPDKAGSAGVEYFMEMRRSIDVLRSPIKRFAYDRFGPHINEWKDCATIREYMIRGLREGSAVYTLNGAFFFVSSVLQPRKSVGTYWRLVSFALLAATELVLLLRPTKPALFRLLAPGHTVHEIVILLHSLFIAVSMGMNQLNPYFFPARDDDTSSHASELLAQLLDRAERLSAFADVEAQRLLAADIAPFVSAADADASTAKEREELFKSRLADLVVEVRLRRNPDVLAAHRRSRRPSPAPEELPGSPASIAQVLEDAKSSQRVGLGAWASADFRGQHRRRWSLWSPRDLQPSSLSLKRRFPSSLSPSHRGGTSTPAEPDPQLRAASSSHTHSAGGSGKGESDGDPSIGRRTASAGSRTWHPRRAASISGEGPFPPSPGPSFPTEQ